MNGHFGRNFFRSADENVSELDDTPANLLVNIRSAKEAFVSSKPQMKGNHIQCNRHQIFAESFILANFSIFPKNLDHGVEVAFLRFFGLLGH
jgi:hypothetical protein